MKYTINDVYSILSKPTDNHWNESVRKMALSAISSFSENGTYFCSYDQDGKLRIWETVRGILKHEYTPNLHLATPYTCLTWMKFSRSSGSSKKKKKLKPSEEDDLDVIALGTVMGNIHLYSVAAGSIVTQLEETQGAKVNHLTWSKGCNLFSCSNENIFEWDLEEKSVKSKWKAGSQCVSCILVLPDGQTLLSASQMILWWNLEQKQLLKKFTGHASDIMSLTYVSAATESADSYVLSIASGDRYINAWSLNLTSKGQSCVASFVMDDSALCMSVINDSEGGPTTLTAVTHSGHLHIYKHQLNGLCKKPLKPKVTVQIVSDTGQNKEVIQPTPIIAALLCDDNTVLITHGTHSLTFEKISPDLNKKVECLIRQDSRPKVTKEEAVSKVRLPDVNDSVEYVPASMVASSTKIRKLKSDIPMEERLENLALNKPEPKPKGPPRNDNLSQLLIQGLHSKDKRILESVLFNQDEMMMKKTVQRLPVQVIIPLIRVLSTFITERRITKSRIAALWLKTVLHTHASHVLANADITDSFSPIMGLIETRLGNLAPLSRLRGRLDMIVDQIKEGLDNERREPQEDSLLVYQDVYTSDEESVVDELALNSDSEEHWDELSEVADDDVEGESETQDTELIDVDMTSDE